MADSSYVQIVLHLNEPEMSDERLESLSQSLLQEFRERDEVERVSRVIDPNPPIGNMAGGGYLPGWLKVEVTLPNIIAFVRFLGDRLINKTFELEVEYKDKEITKIKAKGSSREDIKALLEEAKSVIKPEVEIIRVVIESAEEARAAIEPTTRD
jgi:hypothetical protein